MPLELSTAADKWKTFPIQCVGGLNTSLDTLSYRVGEATQLLNFEPSLFGGYRRINGFEPYDTQEVPGTGSVLGVAVFPGTSGKIIACRSNDVYVSTGSGWSASIGTRTGAKKYRFAKYRLGSGQNVAMCDQVNPAAKYDGTTYTLINGTGAPANPKYCTFWDNRLVLAGYSSNLKAFSMSAPNTDTDFSGVNGAIEINTYSTITNVRAFRDILYIFCINAIYKLTGTTSADFALIPVSSNLGCNAPDSVQEVNGNLIYLAPDGFRTVAGTDRIGDVSLASISKQILSIVTDMLVTAGDPDNISSIIIRGKNQYRFFCPNANDPESDAYGLIAAVRQGHSVNETAFGRIIDEWEWGQTVGIKPACADSDFLGVHETIVHGGYDGFVYQQELGNSFNGASILAVYQTAPLTLEDPEIRKALKKLDLFFRIEGVTNISASLIYEFEFGSQIQTPPVMFTSPSSLFAYDDAGTKYDDVAIYSTGILTPEVSNNVQGSGFIVQILFTTSDTNPSYSIQAITLQFRPLSRR